MNKLFANIYLNNFKNNHTHNSGALSEFLPVVSVLQGGEKMSTYFIGFGISQGDFLNSEKETVSYSNRLLRCVTDDGVDDFNVGF